MIGHVQTIHGQVVDPQGNPVTEAAVYIAAAPVNMPDVALLTDEQGNFVIGAPVTGRYEIGARSEPWVAVEVKVEVQEGQSAVVKILFTTKQE